MEITSKNKKTNIRMDIKYRRVRTRRNSGINGDGYLEESGHAVGVPGRPGGVMWRQGASWGGPVRARRDGCLMAPAITRLRPRQPPTLGLPNVPFSSFFCFSKLFKSPVLMVIV